MLLVSSGTLPYSNTEENEGINAGGVSIKPLLYLFCRVMDLVSRGNGAPLKELAGRTDG